MASLQTLMLREHGQNQLRSRRKILYVAMGIMVVGGASMYARSWLGSRCKKDESFANHIEPVKNKEKSYTVEVNGNFVGKTRQRKGGLQSLQVLVAILLSHMCRKGMGDLVSLVGIVVIRSSLSNRLAKVQGFLFRAVFLKSIPSFLRLIIENFLLCLLQSTLFSTSKYITGILSLRFRKILTDNIHQEYFENMVYYKISHVDGRITNPEHRVASDIPRFCLELSNLLREDLTALTDALLYTWHLSSYTSPKYALWMLAYVIVAGAMIRKFSPPFGKLMSKEQQLEGEYRQLHSRLRTHAESVAFYGGQDREESFIKQKFKSLVQHMNIVLFQHWWFGMIQDFLVKYLGATVAVILILDPFYSGNLRPDTSALGGAEVLSNLRYHTSVIISLFQALGTLGSSPRQLNRLSGYADRIHELMSTTKELGVAHENGSNYFREATYIEFSGVKIVTPSGNVLVENLNLKVESGSNLLITGPNGSGKSSLFRVLGGLWPLVSGYIVKPGSDSALNKDIFYVPQRPYMVVGTLRDQLIYPLAADEEIEPLTHSGMTELLKNVDLEYLLDRYPPEKEINWGNELSLGEQQRLGMARLFYHKPKFAILDECTSAVTTDMEQRFCSNVRAMGTSCITISHRPTLVAFHNIVLSLDGEGGCSVIHKNHRHDSSVPTKVRSVMKSSETARQIDALAVQRAFTTTSKDTAFSDSKVPSNLQKALVVSPSADHEDTAFSDSKVPSNLQKALVVSPSADHEVTLPIDPQLLKFRKSFSFRMATTLKVVVPTLLDRQGVQLFTVALLVASRTWISDRIASLNGTTVKYALDHDRASFIRLISMSVFQSAASSFIAPSLRYLAAKLALGWRIRLTKHLLIKYLRKSAFYKVSYMSGENVDVDQRITHDVEKLVADLSGLVLGMVKPSIDILWFTWRMKMLTGQRGIAILYTYMLLGLGFLRTVTPEFGDFSSEEQQLEGTYRFMHTRLRTHAESIAFFGGGAREKAMVESKFRKLLDHSKMLLKKKWMFGIMDDFVTKQLPHNVTWGLSLLYAMEHKGDRTLTSAQGELAHALLFLASVVSHSFLAFGDILELHKKYLELSGGINRIFELEEYLDSDQCDLGDTRVAILDNASSFERSNAAYADTISFSKVDILTPKQKLLARELTFELIPGKNLLLTGPNGSGKTSIFRVLRGLWPTVSGTLTTPCQNINQGPGCSKGLFYVPQRPYTCFGTLRDQIIYPVSYEEAKLRVLKMSGKDERSCDAAHALDTCLRSILENVRLVYILEREDEGWDTIMNWEDVLSLGEQQRLGMARLFFHNPKFGILDECTNATSVDIEEHLYRLASEIGITVLTASQRPALIPFHSMELRLIDGEGAWELNSITHHIGVSDTCDD